MSGNIQPIYTKTPVIGVAQISTANTAKDGTGTLGTVVTGAENGTRVTRITVNASGSSCSNGMVRLFIDNTSTKALFKEIPVVSGSWSGSALGFSSTNEFLGERAIELPQNYSLLVSTNAADSFNVFAEGGNY